MMGIAHSAISLRSAMQQQLPWLMAAGFSPNGRRCCTISSLHSRFIRLQASDASELSTCVLTPARRAGCRPSRFTERSGPASWRLTLAGA